MNDHSNQTSLRSIGRSVKSAAWSMRQIAVAALRPTLLRWWHNPLLLHARREKPLSWPLIGRWFGLSTGLLTILSILAWFLNWRLLGASLIGLSLGAVLASTLAAPVVSADRVARQLHFPKHDPRRLKNIAPHQVVWGLALVTLWQLRWLVVAGLAATPALVIGLLRMDLASFGVWQDSMQVLGASTPAGSMGWLPSDGHIPYFRLVIRAMSAGLLPCVTLPLLASLGVASALVLRDAGLSPLVGLLGGVLLSGLIVWGWNSLTRTSLLADGLETVRVILLMGVLMGIGVATVWINRWNEETLGQTPTETQNNNPA